MAIPKEKAKKASLLKAKKEQDEDKEIKVAIMKGDSIAPYYDKNMAKSIFGRFRAKGMNPKAAQRAMIKRLLEMQQDEIKENQNY
jgi:hypothetical protein